MGGMQRFRSSDPDQLLLLPTDMRQWLPEDDLVYFIIDVVGEVDLSAIYKAYDHRRGGGPAYEPRLMVSLLLYAYCVGLPSSRRAYFGAKWPVVSVESGHLFRGKTATHFGLKVATLGGGPKEVAG